MNTIEDETPFEARLRINRENTERGCREQSMAAQARELARCDREVESAALARKAMANLLALLAKLDPEQVEHWLSPNTLQLIKADIDYAAARGKPLGGSAPHNQP